MAVTNEVQLMPMWNKLVAKEPKTIGRRTALYMVLNYQMAFMAMYKARAEAHGPQKLQHQVENDTFLLTPAASFGIPSCGIHTTLTLQRACRFCISSSSSLLVSGVREAKARRGASCER